MRHQYAVIALWHNTVDRWASSFFRKIGPGSHYLPRWLPECGRDMTESGLEILPGQVPESQSENARFVTKPGTVRHPHASRCQGVGKALYRGVVE